MPGGASRARWKAFQALDRPGLRSALGLARSADILLRDHELCLVAPDRAGGWRLRAAGSVVVGPGPNLPPPRRLREHVLDVFCHVREPGPGDTVLDVGAGIGRAAITFSELVGATGAVHCIEAHPGTFDFLRRAVELNRLDNVHCHHVAISDAPGEVVMATEGDPRLYYRNKLVRGGTGLAVPATTMAEFMTTHDLESVDLLAMNVEGSERAALLGIAPVADRIRSVAVACHDFLAEETGDESMRTKTDVKELLASHGFEVVEREDATRPWLGDFVYGVRR